MTISRVQTTESRMAGNLAVGSVVWVDLGHSYGWWPALLQDKKARREISKGDIIRVINNLSTWHALVMAVQRTGSPEQGRL